MLFECTHDRACLHGTDIWLHTADSSQSAVSQSRLAAAAKQTSPSGVGRKNKYGMMSDALRKAWCWPGLGLCTYTYMYAEEACSWLQIRRNCLDPFTWSAWHVWTGLLYVLICLGSRRGRCRVWSDSWDTRAAEHTWRLAGFSKQTRKVHSNVLVALGGHGTQPFPTPPPASHPSYTPPQRAAFLAPFSRR